MLMLISGAWRTLTSMLVPALGVEGLRLGVNRDRKSTRLNSSHLVISYAVFCLKKKKRLDNYCDLLIRNRRLLLNLQHTWPNRYSMPIAVHYTHDPRSRAAGFWPAASHGEQLKV